ncbi:MAG: MFS transporter [Deltaproteobacteria bacterium]|nr:MFS transporter [Deltaproteobacteria bacterium]
MKKYSSTKKERFAWALYDFANSAFPTVIVTAVYVIYFKNVVVGNELPGYSDKLWGIANSAGAALVFLMAPFLGAVADLSGKKRFFWVFFALMSIAATATLSLTGQGTVLLAMAAFIIALTGFEASTVFYNSFLPELVPPDKIDRLSGAGWALGYLGGLGCLAIVLPVAMDGTNIKLVALIVAAWFLLFSIPSFVSIKDRSEGTSAMAWTEGFNRLKNTVLEIKKHKNLVRFLTAYFFYNNAVVTIIVFAVAFSKDSLQFSTTENILLVLVMNIIAAPGAYFFGMFSEKMGSKKTIVITLVLWLFVVLGAELSAWPDLFSAADSKLVFWGVAVLASLGIGAIQSTSRTFVGQMAPTGRSAEFYGFMAFSGKGSAILGPLVFGLVSSCFASQRAAILSIGLFFLIGLILMIFVNQEREKDE